MHCWGIDIEAMNSKQGCFFVTQIFLSVKFVLGLQMRYFPAILM